ncbi:neuropeptides capa receptor [Biomphalaria glabrata]|nr:neuropeptides capa receptor [Biomphalaria glabrata]
MNTTFASDSLAAAVIDPAIKNVFLTVNLLCLSELIGIFGIAANIVNIIVFKRQGYRDGVNVTLTALAISDLGALCTQQISNTFVDPWIRETKFVMLKTHLFIFMIYAHGYFIRIGGLVTAFAAFERCILVSFPLKVKNFIPSKIAVLVNATFFLVCLLYFIPLWLVVYVDWKYSPAINRSILSMIFRENRESVYSIYYFIADMFVPYATILMLLLFTTVIIRTLKTQSKWRKNAEVNAQRAEHFVSSKQRKVVVMLMAVSVMFMVCLTPHSILHTALGLFREMKVDGTYASLYFVCYSFTTLLETVNCSATIFVYATMSTRYREELTLLVACFKSKFRFHRISL